MNFLKGKNITAVYSHVSNVKQLTKGKQHKTTLYTSCQQITSSWKVNMIFMPQERILQYWSKTLTNKRNILVRMYICPPLIEYTCSSKILLTNTKLCKSLTLPEKRFWTFIWTTLFQTSHLKNGIESICPETMGSF